MLLSPAVHYTRAYIHGWESISCAGNSKQTLEAAITGRSHLFEAADGTFLGRCSPGTLLELSTRAANPAWSQLPDSDRWPGFAAAVSKGDTARWLAEPQADVAALPFCLPDSLQPALARSLGFRYWVGAPPVAACATGLAAVMEVADLLERNRCDIGLAGAADRSLQPLMLAGFKSLGVLSTGMPSAFTGEGTGFAAAEGAGFIALAQQPARWQLCGGVRLGDASHETRCADPSVLQTCLQALWSVLPEPDCIVCHATGTKTGDAFELSGLEAGPWRSAHRLLFKPVIGHCLGANGVVELAAALNGPWKRLWKLSLGFGGHIAAVACQQMDIQVSS